jgi:hypothetical protein
MAGGGRNRFGVRVMNNPFEDDSFIRKLTRYIQDVSSDAPRRMPEVLLILLATIGVWFVGALTLLTWPARHLF